MKEYENLEQELKSWIPRPPSSAVSERIFGKKVAVQQPARQRSFFTPALPWLVPACAAVFTLMTALNSSHSLTPAFVSTNTVPSLAMVWYGEGLFSSANSNWSKRTEPASVRDLNLEWNVFSKTTFEWTNSPQLPSSRGSLSGVQTNF